MNSLGQEWGRGGCQCQDRWVTPAPAGGHDAGVFSPLRGEHPTPGPPAAAAASLADPATGTLDARCHRGIGGSLLTLSCAPGELSGLFFSLSLFSSPHLPFSLCACQFESSGNYGEVSESVFGSALPGKPTSKRNTLINGEEDDVGTEATSRGKLQLVRRYQDLPFAIAFGLCFVAMIIVAIIVHVQGPVWLASFFGFCLCGFPSPSSSSSRPCWNPLRGLWRTSRTWPCLGQWG